jgi:2-polyprenyl-3-methyl-5-hydroxy-6-metoxy-1,4-benzoquinol methylase
MMKTKAISMFDKDAYPHLAEIVDTLVSTWPEHARFLGKSFSERDITLMSSTERRAATILAMVGRDNIPQYCMDYRTLCNMLEDEELYFRRHGAYRLKNFEDAVSEVYSNKEFMNSYMNFIALSYVLWTNHARAMAHFEENYIPNIRLGSHHLEIGPGHGLLLYFATTAANVASVTGWDVSAASIAQTKKCLASLGVTKPVSLVLQNLFDAPDERGRSPRFDSVVLSEVLEHLEDPASALRAVSRHMAENGRIWINVPINSPAPDHIYLLRSTEEAINLVATSGFKIVGHDFFPITGSSLKRARQWDLTISAVITAEKI